MRDAELANAFDAQRSRLRGVAYRITGSLAEADDAVQEAWLRLQRTDATTIDDLAAWLTTVTARIALNLLRGRRETPVAAFLPEPIVDATDESDPEHEALLADAVGIALQVVLDTLSPAERVAYVLHDMFAIPFSEIAELIDRSPDAARQLASRARRRVRDSAPAPDADLAAQSEIISAYFSAARDGDIDTLAALLAPDVVIRAHRPGQAPTQLRGREAAIRSARAGARQAAKYGGSARPARINGGLGLIAYRDGVPVSIVAITIRSNVIMAIDIFHGPELVAGLLR